MISSDLIPSWTTVQAALASGAPKRFRVSTTSALFLQIDPNVGWLGLLIPWKENEDPPISPLKEIEIGTRLVDQSRFLTIGTRSHELKHECFSFLLTLAATIQTGSIPPYDALVQELASWESLLLPAPRMTREEEIGLLGELWTLHRLFAVSGSKAVESWVAVDPESHDFRFGTTDLEVKTTVSNERLHTINNPSQVLPLEGHTLYLLSIQLAPSGVGNGHTLPEAIELLTRSLENDPASMEIFHRGLERRGYRGSDTPQYRTRFKLRNKCALIPIDTFFPAITKDDIVDLLGPDRAIRISRFQYSVKLDGLGELDGSMDFLAVIPSAQSGDLL